jgi:hypothetical protein
LPRPARLCRPAPLAPALHTRGKPRLLDVGRENTGNFIDSELNSASTRAKKTINSIFYKPIPYASEQGIF